MLTRSIDDEFELQLEETVSRPRAITCATVGEYSIRLFLYLGPLADASREAGDTLMSLIASKNTSTPLAVSAAIVSFFSAIGMTGRDMFANIDEVYHYAKGKKPDNWPKLSSPCQAYIALGASLLPALLSISNYSVQTYYFLAALPDEYTFLDDLAGLFPDYNEAKHALHITWIGGSIGAAFWSGVTTALTDGHETHRFFCKYLAKTKNNYPNKIALFISHSIANPLGALGSAQVFVTFYSVMKSVFNIESTLAKSGIALAGGATGLCNFLFFGSVDNQSLYHFVDYLMDAKKRRSITLPMLIAFLLSLSASTFLAITQVALDVAFYKDVASDAGFESMIVNNIIEAICYIMILQNMRTGTSSMYNSTLSCLNFVINKASLGLQKVLSWCTQQESGLNDHSYQRLEIENTSYKNNPHSLWHRTDDEDHTRQEQTNYPSRQKRFSCVVS